MICRNDVVELLFTNRLSATRYMKVKRIGITEILRRIWLFSANKIKSSEAFSKQPTQFIIKLNSSLRQIIDSHLPKCCVNLSSNSMVAVDFSYFKIKKSRLNSSQLSTCAG